MNIYSDLKDVLDRHQDNSVEEFLSEYLAGKSIVTEDDFRKDLKKRFTKNGPNANLMLCESSTIASYIYDDYVLNPTDTSVTALWRDHFQKDKNSERAFTYAFFTSIFNKDLVKILPSVRKLHTRIFEEASVEHLFRYWKYGLDAFLTKSAARALTRRLYPEDIRVLHENFEIPIAKSMWFLQAFEEQNRMFDFKTLFDSLSFSPPQFKKLHSLLKSPDTRQFVKEVSAGSEFEYAKAVLSTYNVSASRLCSVIKDAYSTPLTQNQRQFIHNALKDREPQVQMSLAAQLPELQLSLSSLLRHWETSEQSMFHMESPAKAFSQQDLRTILERETPNFTQEQTDELFVLSSRLPPCSQLIIDIYNKKETPLLSTYKSFAFRDILDRLVEESSCETRVDALQKFLPALYNTLCVKDLDSILALNSRFRKPFGMSAKVEAQALRTFCHLDDIKSLKQLFGEFATNASPVLNANGLQDDSHSFQEFREIAAPLSTTLLAIQSSTIRKAVKLGVIASPSALTATLNAEPTDTKRRRL